MRLYFLFLLTLGFCVAGCGNSKSKLVDDAPLISKDLTDDTGRKIHLDKAPERVISLAPSITEIVCAVGAQSKLVARSQACDYPKSVDSLAFIPVYPSLDVEKLQSMKADIILTTDEIFSRDAIATLEAKGLPVYLQSYKQLSDVFRGIRNIGKLVECEPKANHLADSLEKIVRVVTDSTQNTAKYRTMILVGDEPLKVIGGTGYLNELIEKAGGLNIFAEKKEAYPSTTVEEILLLQPEYLIIPAKDQEAYTQLIIKYPPLHNTLADLQHHVFLVDPDLFFRPGPRSVEALLTLTNILHSNLTPDKFK